jgi:hypothetical protein
MTEQRTITTGPGLTFDVLTAGPANGARASPPRLRRIVPWRPQVQALAAAGYRAVAPHQRGYSPGARPDTADASNYEFDKLIGDAMNIAAGAGRPTAAFIWSGTTGAAASPGASRSHLSASPR